MIVVFDIDGTLTLVGERVAELHKSPPNWDRFYARVDEDEPNVPVIQTLKAMRDAGHLIVLASGRREATRRDTEFWMKKHGVRYDHMLLRPNGDKRHDTEVKPELLVAADIRPDLIFEDRKSMVDHWRKLGIPTFQVARGDF